MGLTGLIVPGCVSGEIKEKQPVGICQIE